MNIQSITWQEALPIRHKVLWPDETVYFCKVDGDESAKHYGVYVNKQLVCVASIYSENNIARLRKFATLAEFQGQGIGSTLIHHILNELKMANIDSFWCDARTTAVGFYQRIGLEKQGTEFNKSGINYFKMEVSLQ